MGAFDFSPLKIRQFEIQPPYLMKLFRTARTEARQEALKEQSRVEKVQAANRDGQIGLVVNKMI